MKKLNRKNFIRKGLFSVGTIVSIPSILSACDKDKNPGNENCDKSPTETAGPFPNKTPAELARENIISDRSGVPFLIKLIVQDHNNSCQPISGALVDIWHCDAKGLYSQYGSSFLQEEDLTSKSFLRGRQTTNSRGEVSFISIFPGWYRGRAPHIHVEVFDSSENSLIISQIAFPKDICDAVYKTNDYRGSADTQNESDNIFNDSLDGNMADSIEGNNNEGYTLFKTIIV